MSWLVEKIYNIFARGSMISPVSTSPPSVVQAHSPICQGVATRLRSALSFGQHLAKQMMIVGDLSVDVVDLDTLNFRGSHSLYHLEGCLMRNLKWQPIPQGLKLRPSVRTIDVEDPPTPPPPPPGDLTSILPTDGRSSLWWPSSIVSLPSFEPHLHL